MVLDFGGLAVGCFGGLSWQGVGGLVGHCVLVLVVRVSRGHLVSISRGLLDLALPGLGGLASPPSCHAPITAWLMVSSRCGSVGPSTGTSGSKAGFQDSPAADVKVGNCQETWAHKIPSCEWRRFLAEEKLGIKFSLDLDAGGLLNSWSCTTCVCVKSPQTVSCCFFSGDISLC